MFVNEYLKNNYNTCVVCGRYTPHKCACSLCRKIALEDDNTPNGGKSYANETLDDFVQEIQTSSLQELNANLSECGIEPIDSINFSKSELERQWADLEDVPFDINADNELVLTNDWNGFDKNTPRTLIWLWFDTNYPGGVNKLL